MEGSGVQTWLSVGVTGFSSIRVLPSATGDPVLEGGDVSLLLLAEIVKK